MGRWLRQRHASLNCRPLSVRVDKHIHLLADEQRELVVFDAVDDLKDARVHTLGAIAGKRFLWHHERFEPHECERCFQTGVTAHGRRCVRSGLNPRRFVFFHVHTDV